ncbi:hypothetical protein GUY44_11430 [Pimelobacter simplex]|uniref:DUF5667 domain-containing protein n=1 Tax=Nocardioides simplex TaxID=2045 RepID=A0A0C5WXR8_NOCSI|nr:DUF5667 domain-containing protein [Pimelobacter simplex]AJR18088.1 hypothetical protein KR76_03610 [Pimelobacter simplex]MCG8151092.1 hypothetical protein [Pimelobacter simplex]GEB12276.1 hypothetical protein NSI01_05910 [Pimelobacter simplex]SFM97322.1 hypothetical protein SAMN05421671_4455 [Pimelobacter simplex]
MVMRGNAGARGAEEFDALVSSGRAGDHEAYADLLELVAALRAVPPVEARPEFVSSLRTQLVAAAEREPARADEALAVRLTPRQRRGARERRLAALVGGFAVVAATGSMAMAAQDALPGDVLYPVKRAIENAQTNLQGNGASKAETLIAHAEARLTEVQELTARGADDDAISSTLQDFTDQAKQASELALDDYAATGKPARIADLRSFARSSMAGLAQLGPDVPAASRPILITATQTIRQIDAAAWEACPTCADGAVTEVPDFATLPLSAVLSGNAPGTASVSKVGTPGGPAKPEKKPAGQQPTTPPPSTTTPPANVPVDVPTDVPTTKGLIDGLLEPITNGGKKPPASGGNGGGGGSTPTAPSSTLPLLDGVTSLLGGLLGTTK